MYIELAIENEPFDTIRWYLQLIQFVFLGIPRVLFWIDFLSAYLFEMNLRIIANYQQQIRFSSFVTVKYVYEMLYIDETDNQHII